MALKLPAKTSKPTPQTIAALDSGLTSVIAGHPGSLQPWTFYEELDAYLGPWGDQGYPIAYGKFYCIAFNTEPNLRANRDVAEWIDATTVQLQTRLKDYTVGRYKKGTLATITEAELRQFAFDSHPDAYTQGGLAKVMLLAPHMLPFIAAIPYAQFNPFGDNFGSTLKQVFVTAGMTVPLAAGLGIAAAMPAHSGIWRNAMELDRRRMQEDLALGRWLESIDAGLRSGELNYIPALEVTADRLNRTAFPDASFAQAARGVLARIEMREHEIAARYREALMKKPELVQEFDRYSPGWAKY